MDKTLVNFLESKFFITHFQEDSPYLMTVKIKCPFCDRCSQMQISMDGANLWAHGTNIQNALPNLSADQREQLISGVCPSCWAKTFAEEP